MSPEQKTTAHNAHMNQDSPHQNVYRHATCDCVAGVQKNGPRHFARGPTPSASATKKSSFSIAVVDCQPDRGLVWIRPLNPVSPMGRNVDERAGRHFHVALFEPQAGRALQ